MGTNNAREVDMSVNSISTPVISPELMQLNQQMSKMQMELTDKMLKLTIGTKVEATVAQSTQQALNILA